MIRNKFFKGVATVALATSALLITDGTASADNVESSKTLHYACEANAPLVGKVDVPMEVEINATVPEMVSANQRFTIDESYTKVTILETRLLKVASNEVKGQVTEFNLNIDNATIVDDPESDTVNVAEEALDIPPTPFPSGDTVTFRVPEEGGVDVGKLEAADEGVVTVTAGEITTVLNTNLGNIEAHCSPTANNPVLNQIGIDHIYVPDENEDEEDESQLNEIQAQVEQVGGVKNKAADTLDRLVLEEGKILPSNQAEKVREALINYLDQDEVEVDVKVQHPLSTVIGTSVTQAFEVTLTEGRQSVTTTVHASFLYAHQQKHEAPDKLTDLELATASLDEIQGSKNNATNELSQLQLDAGKILPARQAEKVKVAIENHIDREDIEVNVEVIHPLTTVIGTGRTQAFKVTLSDGEETSRMKVHASFLYSYQDRNVEESIVHELIAATQVVEDIKGERNKANNALRKIGLDAWKILPSHQAGKVKEAIELNLHNENIKDITVDVAVIHPLSTVIGTNRTQAFKVTLSDGEDTNTVNVHASFNY